MVLIETVNCNTKLELLKMERKYIEELKPSLNKQIPSMTRKEYYIENKELIKLNVREYRAKNREIYNQKCREYQAKNREQINEKKIGRAHV